MTYSYFVRAATSSGGANASGYSAHDTGWRPTVYTLTYIPGPGGDITGTLSQPVASGGSGTAFTAAPHVGAAFREWSDGVLTAQRQDTGVSGDLTVTAHFRSDGGASIDGYDGHGISRQGPETWAEVDGRYNPAKDMTLLEEYYADTNPNEPTDIFRILEVTADTPLRILLTPDSLIRYYTLQYRTRRTEGERQDVPGQVRVPGGAGALPGVGEDDVFYRVRVWDAPGP